MCAPPPALRPTVRAALRGWVAALLVGWAAVLVALTLLLGRLPSPRPLPPVQAPAPLAGAASVPDRPAPPPARLQYPQDEEPPGTMSATSQAADRTRDTPQDGSLAATDVDPPLYVPPAPIARPPASATGVAAGDRPDHLDRSPDARRRRTEAFGGTPSTENAVELGLAWLAAHQEKRGTWNRLTFPELCPPGDRCAGAAVWRENEDLAAGTTGLVLLAFLGAGYTDREGPYRDNVARGVAALLALQRDDGGFSRAPTMAGYDNSLATFALAEYCDLTGDARARAALQRGVERLVLSQQALGGWDYVPEPDSGRNDTSITGWAVQALQAAAAAGARVPRAALARAALHMVRATEGDGRVRYADTGIGTMLADGTRPTFRFGPAMTAVGLTCGQLLGGSGESPVARRQQALLLGQLPSTSLSRGGDPDQLHSEYYWYYATVALFQLGGPAWERWNAALRDVLLPLQDRAKTADGKPRHHTYGSWTPFGQNWGRWGRMGGRIYSTAIAVLTLEVYYRHTPAYLAHDAALATNDWVAFLAESAPRERRLAVQALSQLRLEIGEPVLLAALADADRGVATAAATALAELGSPAGEAVLKAALAEVAPEQRVAARAALSQIAALRALPEATGTLRVVDAGQRLVTLDLPRGYAGMRLAVQRFGLEIGRVRVLRRYTGRALAVAEIEQASVEMPPAAGDAVVGR